MNGWLLLLAALAGYLLGALSFARIVTRVFSPAVDITKTDAPVEGYERPLRMHGVSGTSVRIQLGARYGCLSSALDMVKVTIPTLVFYLFWPDSPYYWSQRPRAFWGTTGPSTMASKGAMGRPLCMGACSLSTGLAFR